MQIGCCEYFPPEDDGRGQNGKKMNIIGPKSDLENSRAKMEVTQYLIHYLFILLCLFLELENDFKYMWSCTL